MLSALYALECRVRGSFLRVCLVAVQFLLRNMPKLLYLCKNNTTQASLFEGRIQAFHTVPVSLRINVA